MDLPTQIMLTSQELYWPHGWRYCTVAEGPMTEKPKLAAITAYKL